MTNDQARALVLVGALVTGGSFIGERGPAPMPPKAEVRFIHVPPAAPLAEFAPVIKPEKPIAPVEVKPRPKVEAKPKPAPAKKPRAAPVKAALPSCTVIKREYDRMTWAQQMSAYHKATPEQIAHGKRCLGF